MKLKLFASTLVTVSSLSAMALPAQTDALIKALVGSGKLAEIVAQEQNIGSVQIKRVDTYRDSQSIMSLCGNDALSRSGSVLEVQVDYRFKRSANTMTPAVQSSHHYLVTRGDAADLRNCDGRN